MEKIAAELRHADVTVRKELVYPGSSCDDVATHGIERKHPITPEQWDEMTAAHDLGSMCDQDIIPNPALRLDSHDENGNLLRTPSKEYEDTQEDSPDMIIVPDEIARPDDSQPGGNECEIPPPGIPDVIEEDTHDVIEDDGGEAPSGSHDPAPKSKPAKKTKTLDQILKHRTSSNSWHSKWVPKGVPRVVAPKAKSTGGRAKAKAAPVPPVDPSNSSVESLSKARDLFITKWIHDSGMSKSQERRKAACDAWMKSSLRAQLLASRTGTQKWSSQTCFILFYVALKSSRNVSYTQ